MRATTSRRSKLSKAEHPSAFVLGKVTSLRAGTRALSVAVSGKWWNSRFLLILPTGQRALGTASPPNSTLKFKIEILASAAPGDQSGTYFTFKDIGVKTKKLGLTPSMLELVEQTKIGLNSNDSLSGGAQADLLIGLKGKDQLVGNLGSDVLIGGKGKNRFIYNAIDDSPNRDGEQDQILGFSKKDKLDLSGFDQKLRFIDGDAFKGTAGDVRFQQGDPGNGPRRRWFR